MRSTLIACVLLLASRLQAAPLVVETDPLPPDQQQAKFHHPPGFEIQLVACEPDIGQPMNLNFDAQGRLWVTHSVEYPYPVAGEGVEPRDGRFQGMGTPPARDRLTVISGIGPDGKPASIVHFAEGLNIPIGVVPLDGGMRTENRGVGQSTIAFTIPYITQFTDTNGDGVSDEQQRLYGPFGNLDTHGMASSFTRWIDGWIYGCHGFRNTSTVKGTDGHEFTMNSGNTYRFKADGSRIEQVTWGQVNPFGMTFDRWGNCYNADCHSMPLTCLLPGAYYQSFGKPHDGLGYGPDMIDHIHGSTGICGVAWYEAPQFPAEYQDCIYLCNPVNGQVHRDRIAWRGSTPWVETQPDFVTCDDGWFRPVDVKLGPDGALYIADFYNAIIGHYEVPLEHPRRDREHGRIWRVVYVGDEEQGTRTEERESQDPSSRTRQSSDQSLTTSATTPRTAPILTLDHLGDANFAIRTLATNELIDRGLSGSDRYLLLTEWINNEHTPERERGVVNALWVLERTAVEHNDANREWQKRLFTSPSALVRVHACHLLRERKQLTAAEVTQLHGWLDDPEPKVQRAAVQALGHHATAVLAVSLPSALQQMANRLAALATADGQDTHLRHAAKMALRNWVLAADYESLQNFDAAVLQHSGALPQEIALGTRHANGAAMAFTLMTRDSHAAANPELLRHVARYAEPSQLESIITHLSGSETTPDQQLATLQALHAGLQERGVKSTALARWGSELALKLLAQSDWQGIDWTYLPLPGNPAEESPFVPQQRVSADGDTTGFFFGSLPKGEQRTGVLRSDSFELPQRLTFFIAGHNAFPENPIKGTSWVRLRERDSGLLLQEVAPPRNDMAQKVVWDLTDQQGKHGYLEIIDGDTDTAYAWLAVGRFSIPALNPGAASPAKQAAQLISTLQIQDLQPRLAALAVSTTAPLSTRVQAAEAWLSFRPESRRQALLATARMPVPAELRESCLQAVVSELTPAQNELLALAMQSASQRDQARLAELLVTDAVGGEALLGLVQQGKASGLLLTRVDLVERLKSLQLPQLEERLTQLTASLPPANEQVAELIQQRKLVVESSQPDLTVGAALFQKHCAACHQYKGVGNKVGPQLEGVGVRGVDRILEDILDPNRNVDGAFRTSVIALKSGQVLTGLKRREEGATLVFANNEGKEFTVNSVDIEEQRPSPLSLMPANVAEQVPPADFAQLVLYLLAK